MPYSLFGEVCYFGIYHVEKIHDKCRVAGTLLLLVKIN